MYFQKEAIGRNKRERTRGLIIDSAIEAFSRDGISGAKVAGIAKQAGVTTATFYNHFEGKQELSSTTAEAITIEIAKAIDASLKETDDPVLKVTALCSCTLKVVLSEPNWAAIIVDSFHFLRAARENVTQYLRHYIEAGVNAGKFNIELDDFLMEQLASLVMSSIRNQLSTGYSARNTERTCLHVLRLLGLSNSSADKAINKWRPTFKELELPLPGLARAS